jgi:hypothetical protein
VGFCGEMAMACVKMHKKTRVKKKWIKDIDKDAIGAYNELTKTF